jgi:hypothetical protein
MTWFTENPLMPVVIGIVVEAGLVVGLAKTGKRSFLWGMIATLAVVMAAVVAEGLIVTPREAVTATIEEMRAALAANDRVELLTHIEPTRIPLRNQVQNDLALVTVTEAKINDLKVEVDDSGKIAKAVLKGVVHFEGTAATLGARFVPVRIHLDLQRRDADGKWLVKEANWEVARSPSEL